MTFTRGGRQGGRGFQRGLRGEPSTSEADGRRDEGEAPRSRGLP